MDLQKALRDTVVCCHDHSADFIKKFCSDADELESVYMAGSSCQVAYFIKDVLKRIYVRTDKIIDWAKQYESKATRYADTISVIKTVDDLSEIVSFPNDEAGRKEAEALFLDTILPYCLDKATGAYDTDQFMEDGFIKVRSSLGTITVQLTASMNEFT